MLISSIDVGLAAIVLTAILLAADWYVWEPRYRISHPWGLDLANRPVADGKRQIQPRRAAGGGLVAALASQSLAPKVLAKGVQSGWTDHCSQD
jgi:hypothetical protein